MGDHEDPPWESIKHALNDLARGQQDIVQKMKAPTQSMASIQGNQFDNGAGGSNNTLLGGSNGHHVEANNTFNMVPPLVNKITIMPFMLKLLGGQDSNQYDRDEGFSDYLREYQTLGATFHATMSLQDYCTIKYHNKTIDHNQWWQNNDVSKKVSKINVYTFNGSSNVQLELGSNNQTHSSSLTP